MHPPKGRILCAEDDHDARELIIFTLRLNGYQVTCVENGTEALSLAKNEHFDLFLVDNWLPGLNGPELTRHIREFNRTTPVLSTLALPMNMTSRPLLTQAHKATLSSQ